MTAIFDGLDMETQANRMLESTKTVWEAITKVRETAIAAGLTEEQATVEASLAATMAATTAACCSGPRGLRLEDVVRIYAETERSLNQKFAPPSVQEVPRNPNSN